jgi:lysophospholipase L1-like esterase
MYIAVVLVAVAILTTSRLLGRGDNGSQQHFDVICVGDSLTAGFVRTSGDKAGPSFHPYSEALEEALGPRHRVLPLGFSGWTSVKLLKRANVRTRIATERKHGKLVYTRRPGIALAIRLHQPRVAVIMAGTNDVFRIRNVDGHMVADRVWKLHDIAHRAAVRTIALGIPEWSPQRDRTPVEHTHRLDIRRELNARLKSYASNNSQLATYVDFPFSFEPESPLWSDDGLHLTAKGYYEVGVRLAKHVRLLLM